MFTIVIKYMQQDAKIQNEVLLTIVIKYMQQDAKIQIRFKIKCSVTAFGRANTRCRPSRAETCSVKGDCEKWMVAL
jgi:hypothetical protein